MGINSEQFYNPELVAILPMGFCYPGLAKQGDFPPRPECEGAWRASVLSHLQHLEIMLVLGRYAQNYHFNHRGSLTELVESWQTFWPDKIPLPHPSPRNNRWLKNNPWFVTELLPELQVKIAQILAK
jgi:uracil-DNA glycosylase